MEQCIDFFKNESEINRRSIYRKCHGNPFIVLKHYSWTLDNEEFIKKTGLKPLLFLLEMPDCPLTSFLQSQNILIQKNNLEGKLIFNDREIPIVNKNQNGLYTKFFNPSHMQNVIEMVFYEKELTYYSEYLSRGPEILGSIQKFLKESGCIPCDFNLYKAWQEQKPKPRSVCYAVIVPFHCLDLGQCKTYDELFEDFMESYCEGSSDPSDYVSATTGNLRLIYSEFRPTDDSIKELDPMEVFFGPYEKWFNSHIN